MTDSEVARSPSASHARTLANHCDSLYDVAAAPLALSPAGHSSYDKYKPHWQRMAAAHKWQVERPGTLAVPRAHVLRRQSQRLGRTVAAVRPTCRHHATALASICVCRRRWRRARPQAPLRCPRWTESGRPCVQGTQDPQHAPKRVHSLAPLHHHQRCPRCRHRRHPRSNGAQALEADKQAKRPRAALEQRLRSRRECCCPWRHNMQYSMGMRWPALHLGWYWRCRLAPGAAVLVNNERVCQDSGPRCWRRLGCALGLCRSSLQSCSCCRSSASTAAVATDSSPALASEPINSSRLGRLAADRGSHAAGELAAASASEPGPNPLPVFAPRCESTTPRR